MSQLFSSGGQKIGTSVLASVLPMSIQGGFTFKIDWFGLLAVQGTFKSLLHHRSSKASILWCSAFFTMIKTLSQRYMTTGKMTALTRQTLVGKVVFLLFNTV